MSPFRKKILIIDEDGFSRICFAIFELEGFTSEIITDIDLLRQKVRDDEFSLVVTSYPFGTTYLREIKEKNIPTVILSDQINRDLINLLQQFENSYCMVKPIDYRKFRSLVKQMVNGELALQGGYSIV
jgi:DNA-binding NtrC family response regulator